MRKKEEKIFRWSDALVDARPENGRGVQARDPDVTMSNGTRTKLFRHE